MAYTDRIGPILRDRFGIDGLALALSISRVAELREVEFVGPFNVAKVGTGYVFAGHTTPGRIVCRAAGAGCELCGNEPERCVVFGADAT